MRWELFVGLRYLRSRRREKFVSVITAISTISVLLGVMVLTIVLSVMTGFEEDLRKRILGLNPHVRVVDRLSGGTISEPAEFVAIVEENPGVLGAAPVVTAQMLVSANGRMLGVIGRGVESGSDSVAIGILDFVVEGDAAALGQRHVVDGADLPGVMIGAELSRRTGVRLGETLTLMVPSLSATPFGAIPRSRRFVVVALYDSGMIEYDSGLVYLGIEDARTLLRLDAVATGIEAVLVDPYDAPRIAAELNQRLGMPYWAQSWTEVHRNVFEALQLEKTVYFLVLMLIILVAAFTIVASLYMIVMEKRRDVAVLKSMGATDTSVALIFVLKGLLIGLLGTISGVVLGYLFCVLLGRYEIIDLPEGVFYVSTVPVRIVPANFAVVAACSIVICLAATLFPAWKAARVVPVDVLRYE